MTDEQVAQKEVVNERAKANGLKQEWMTFLRVVGNPQVGLFLLFTLALAALTVFTIEHQLLLGAMTAFSSFLAGLTGAFFARRWEQLAEKTRAKSAVRGLGLKLLSEQGLQQRIQLIASRYAEQPLSAREAQIVFEELVGLCKMLQDQTSNAIQEWTDTLPVGELPAHIGLIAAFKEQIQAVDTRHMTLQAQLKAAAKLQDASDAETQKLAGALERSERERQQLKEGLSAVERTVDLLLASGPDAISSDEARRRIFPYAELGLRKRAVRYCPSCARATIAKLGSTHCPACRSKYLTAPE